MDDSFKSPETISISELEAAFNETESAQNVPDGFTFSPGDLTEDASHHKPCLHSADEQPPKTDTQPQPTKTYTEAGQIPSLSQIEFARRVKSVPIYPQGDAAVQTAPKAEQTPPQPTQMPPSEFKAIEAGIEAEAARAALRTQQCPSMPAVQKKNGLLEQQQPNFELPYKTPIHDTSPATVCADHKRKVQEEESPDPQDTHQIKKKNKAAKESGEKQERKGTDTRRIFGACSVADAAVFLAQRALGQSIHMMPTLIESKERKDGLGGFHQTAILGYPTEVHNFYGTVNQRGHYCGSNGNGNGCNVALNHNLANINNFSGAGIFTVNDCMRQSGRYHSQADDIMPQQDFGDSRQAPGFGMASHTGMNGMYPNSIYNTSQATQGAQSSPASVNPSYGQQNEGELQTSMLGPQADLRSPATGVLDYNIADLKPFPDFDQEPLFQQPQYPPSGPVLPLQMMPSSSVALKNQELGLTSYHGQMSHYYQTANVIGTGDVPMNREYNRLGFQTLQPAYSDGAPPPSFVDGIGQMGQTRDQDQYQHQHLRSWQNAYPSNSQSAGRTDTLIDPILRSGLTPTPPIDGFSQANEKGQASQDERLLNALSYDENGLKMPDLSGEPAIDNQTKGMEDILLSDMQDSLGNF